WCLQFGNSSESTNERSQFTAFQDHITRSVLDPNFSGSDHSLWCSRTAPRKPQARRKVGEKALQRQDEQEEREYVLDSAPYSLTLAQKMGLVASPARRLTEDEWTQIKTRSVLQEESAQPCAVCREEFLLQPQVLLSCSHVFHRTCLQAFERFSGRKCCPMCRREQYETRVIYDAAHLFRHRCATRIQACWRGYVARKWYRHMRKIICPKDKQLRRKFFEAKVTCHFRLCSYAFLRDIDRSLSSSRRVFQQLERKSISEPQEKDWDQIQSQVRKKTHSAEPKPIPSISNHQRRPTMLLSCSHLFHQFCLEAFEAFAADSRPLCPLCRSVYHKKAI
uniref:Ring finger protein 32 n=1 Tax=Mastacembelus armatus TaxID=205130 RepID=A0A3Q3L8L2_9TELE